MESFTSFFRRVGPTATSTIKFWEKTRLKLDRTSNHLSFLSKCVTHQLIPKGLRLKPKIQKPFVENLLKETELRILKNQVTNLRKEVINLNIAEIDACIQVASNLKHTDFKIIVQILNESTSKKYESHRAILDKKFTNISNALPKEPGAPLNQRTLSEIVNLTGKNLDQVTTDLLQKGASFGINATHQHRLDNFVRLNAFSKNKPETSTKACTVFENSIEKSYINKSTEFKKINELRKDKEIKLTKSDKGGKLVLLKTDDYDTKLNNYIQQNFKKLDKDPTNKLQAGLRSFLKNNLHWDQKKILKTAPTYPKTPSIYGLPKTHKEGVPLRPIINQRNTVYSNISKHLAKGLFEVLPRPPSHIKNGKEFSSTLRTAKLPDKYLLLSIDVVDMYPSITPRAALKCLNLKLNCVPDPIFRETLQMEKDQALFLIQSILVSSYFKHQNEFFSQDKGLAMGSPLSPILADIYMDNLEQNILLKYKKDITFWRRYVDDTFLIWNSTLPAFMKFLDFINKIDVNIKFTYELETKEGLPFLDTKVKRNGPHLVTVFYQKPTAGSSLLHFQSYHPLNLKINVAVQKLFKIQDLCTLNIDRMDHKRKLTSDLKNLDYPKRVVNQIFNSLKRRKMKKQEQTNSKYLPLFFEKSKQEEFQKIFNNQLSTVAWKQNNSILDIYKCSGKFSKNIEMKNCVYLIPCSCSQFYIGETSRPLKIRKKEHQRNVLAQDLDSHLATHLLNNPTHQIQWDDTCIIEFEEDNILRKLKEASLIYMNQRQCISRPTIDIEQNWKWILDKHYTTKKIFDINVNIF